MRREGTGQAAEDDGEVIKFRLSPPLSGGLCLSGAPLAPGNDFFVAKEGVFTCFFNYLTSAQCFWYSGACLLNNSLISVRVVDRTFGVV